MIKEQLYKQLVEQIFPQIQENVYELNQFMAINPEISQQEYKSSEKIVQLLKAHGFEVEYPFCGIPTAFKATLNNHSKNKAGILVEYDALPDVGHGCGHCASGAISILAGLALSKVAHEMDVQIDIIGTPDEEYAGAKSFMSDQHVFDDYDFVTMVHLAKSNFIDCNFIALDGTAFKFKGKAAHAAQAPHKGANALNAARLFFDMTDMMRQHVLEDTKMHGYIKSGGVASNVVPEYAEVEFLTRAPKREYLNYVTNWVKDCAKAAAMATKTEVEIIPLGAPFHELYISQSTRNLLLDIFKELNLDIPLPDEQESVTGSSDIGNVNYICPVFHPFIGIGGQRELHTKEFAEAMTEQNIENVIINGALIIIKLFLKLYSDESILSKIQLEHKAYIKMKEK